LLAVYAKHGTASEFYYHLSGNTDPASAADWGAEIVKTVPARNTYSNTYRLTAESNKIFNFHRCINFNPTLTISTDLGVTWGTSTHFISNGGGSTRPYPRYCSNHADRIDLIYTDGHPRDVNNSIYHLYYRAGAFYKTDGTLVKSQANLPLNHATGERGMPVYTFSTAAWGAGQGADDWIPNGRAWTWDIHYGADGLPVCVFQVQRDDVTGTGWNHDRIYYYYARWTGTGWQKRFIAHGGRGIYASEDDYGGGMSLDPEDPRIVYIASNAANPFDLSSITQVQLRTSERYEIWRGFTADGGLTFSWTQITENSAFDNFRPIVPEGHHRIGHLLWFRGTYTTFTNYSTRVLTILGTEKETLQDWQTTHQIAGVPATFDSDSDGVADLVEYTLGSDPGDNSDAPIGKLEGNLFSFRQLTTRTSVETEIQTSPDLNEWTTIATFRNGGLPHTIAPGFLVFPSQQDPTQFSIGPIAPSTEQSKMFVRLRAVMR
jgi:hypothetical protein